MAEHHRLGALEVRVPRDERVRGLFGPGEHGGPEAIERFDQRGSRRSPGATGIRSGRGRCGSSQWGVSGPARRSRRRGDAPPRCGCPHRRGVGADRRRALRPPGRVRRASGRVLRRTQHPGLRQRAGVGLVDADLLRVQPPVEVDGLPQAVERVRGRRGESPAPELHDSSAGESAPERRRMRSGRPKRRMKPSASACRYTSSAPKVAKSSR